MKRGSLQGGIYFRSGSKPPPSFAFLLLDVAAGASPAAVRTGLEGAWATLKELADGRLAELEGADRSSSKGLRDQFTGLEFLFGYGRRLLDSNVHDPPLTACARPTGLVFLDHPDAAFPSLPWAAGSSANRGEADVCIQMTAGHEAATRLAATEIWKYLVRSESPLSVSAIFTGFGRADGRGWLGFHDGVSNLDSSQREVAIRAETRPEWMIGGTYLAFLRIGIDLASWSALTRSEQELLVGRGKLSGRPLIGVERFESGETKPIAAAPVTARSTDVARAEFHEPAQTTDPLLEASHIHRANQNRGSASAPAALRIFRQGYDFFEDFEKGAPRLGLNFVSFQADLLTLQRILHLPGWLGDSNFGGPTSAEESTSARLLTLDAGGFYAVPRRSDPFPGAELFA
ncbi:MAG: deferrochelatase/peroxidase EfeB [Solirubrobacterales bacterium]|jgi:deferrochelatase/peroxidase EfeB|nr:deferrochelatase/peroxidase EfeB [Solirubrobacterales bacterium]